jgi:hypothetical protein
VKILKNKIIFNCLKNFVSKKGNKTKEGALDYIEGAYILVFINKWSKLGALLQTDANEAKMKKKFKISDIAPSFIAIGLSFDSTFC